MILYGSPMQYLTSGAGSKAWRGDVKKGRQRDVKYFYDGQGFMSVQLTGYGHHAEVVFYDVFGKVLHTWKVSKHPAATYSSI